MAINTNKQKEVKKARIASWPAPDDELYQKLGAAHADIAQLQMAFQGTIVLPTDPDYDQDREGNPLYPAYPKIIAYCAVFSDVGLALEWAHRQSDWVVTCRSGGHSTAGFSVNNGMVLDVSRINYVLIDKMQMVMRVGAGANWGQVIAELTANKVHTVTGGCPDVGVAGYTMGGGYGFTSRQFGMSSDTVLYMTVMLADGTIVVASPANQYADLFWALRGGTGNNFGVLLEIAYRIYNLDLLWGFGIRWPLFQAPDALTVMQAQYMKTGAPKELGYQTVLATMKDGTQALAMLGMYPGSSEDGMAILQPLLQTPGAQLFYSRTDTYAYLNEHLLDDNLNPPIDGLVEFKRAGYIARMLNGGDWVQVVKYFQTSPNKFNLVGIEPYGGAINAVSAYDSAFIHRDVSMDFFVDSFFTEDGSTSKEQAKMWLDGFMNLTAGFYNGHVYQNYPWRDFSNYRWAYWGDALPTLVAIKNKYDPGNFFRFEQSISFYPEDDSDITRSKAPSRQKAILGAAKAQSLKEDS